MKYWSVLVDRAGTPKNGCRHFKQLKTTWRVTLCTKFEQNRMKIGGVRPLRSFWPVGWLGWSVRLKLAPECGFKEDGHDQSQQKIST